MSNRSDRISGPAPLSVALSHEDDGERAFGFELAGLWLLAGIVDVGGYAVVFALLWLAHAGRWPEAGALVLLVLGSVLVFVGLLKMDPAGASSAGMRARFGPEHRKPGPGAITPDERPRALPCRRGGADGLEVTTAGDVGGPGAPLARPATGRPRC